MRAWRGSCRGGGSWTRSPGRWALTLYPLYLMAAPPVLSAASGPSGLAVRVEAGGTSNPADCDPASDAVRLVVSEGGRELTHHDFCASYGLARASTAVDGAGRCFVLLESGEGRGTNAVTDYLRVYRLEVDSRLMDVLRTPLAWGVGSVKRFVYRYKVSPVAGGGLRIDLQGAVDEGKDAPWCCVGVPRERHRTITIEHAD